MIKVRHLTHKCKMCRRIDCIREKDNVHIAFELQYYWSNAIA